MIEGRCVIIGLDMYLNRMPRYKSATASDVSVIENYLDWQKEKKEGSEYANCTLKEWCGIDINKMPDIDVVEYYMQFCNFKYYAWDSEHDYGHNSIMEEVGYWRKENMIHQWFVDHVQNGIDDCCYHNECTKEILEELLDTCEKVKQIAVLKPGKVVNGQTLINGKWENCYEDGEVIVNADEVAALLPTQGGFFFGATEYDNWYMRGIEYTIDILTRVLETTDFEKEMVYYVSSW
jgi:hypothetical protein